MQFRFFLSFTLFICGLFISRISAQESIVQYEDSLKVIAREIQTGKDDFLKLNASERFSAMLLKALEIENSFEHPFDSLTSISRLTSEDQKIRIFTWTIAKNDGTFDFGGILQVSLKKSKINKVYKLDDHSSDLLNPENLVLSCDNWYGALYYRLIETSYNKHTYYTLLGWDGNNAFSRKKLIEVLTLSPSGKPQFGSSLFSKFPRKGKRIIFEYSANTSMTLNYSTQMLDVRIKKGKKRVLKKEVREMIVFDRLAPVSASVEGIHQFYYPETNVLDGFIFENGRWIFVREVDARNDPRLSPVKQSKKVEFELFPSRKEDEK
ncbi:MAG: hypothetical protein AB9842_08590 [Bacteroidales bacterium]